MNTENHGNYMNWNRMKHSQKYDIDSVYNKVNGEKKTYHKIIKNKNYKEQTWPQRR